MLDVDLAAARANHEASRVPVAHGRLVAEFELERAQRGGGVESPVAVVLAVRVVVEGELVRAASGELL
eukprot:9456944-Heterocapsa_arctica.AAC.1